MQGFYFVFSGAEIRLLSQWNFGEFFPNFEKNPSLQKKKSFFFEDWDFHSVTTHTSNLLPLHLISPSIF